MSFEQADWIAAEEAHHQRLEFYGSEGTMVWDNRLNQGAVVGTFDHQAPGWSFMERPTDLKTRSIRMTEYLIECDQNQRETIRTVDDDRASLAVALAFY